MYLPLLAIKVLRLHMSVTRQDWLGYKSKICYVSGSTAPFLYVNSDIFAAIGKLPLITITFFIARGALYSLLVLPSSFPKSHFIH